MIINIINNYFHNGKIPNDDDNNVGSNIYKLYHYNECSLELW